MSICVVGGLGYVGLVTSACLAELGHQVAVYDADLERLAVVEAGRLPFHEPGLKDLLDRHVPAGRLRFTRSLADGVRDARIVFIAVATPARSDGETDLSQVIAASEQLARVLRPGMTIVVRSTVPTGTHQILKRILDAHGHVEGRDYDLVAQPEFLREGNAVYDFLHPTRIIIGAASPDARRHVRRLFDDLHAPVLETTFEHAVLIKYASNAFLAMRVSFANELANVCDAVGADVLEVLHGMGYDARIGQAYLSPGIGFGGPCLEKDLLSLIRFAEGAGYEPSFLRAILEKNHHQIRQVIRRVVDSLDANLYGRTIAVLGLAFKPGTSDVRNSLAVRVIDRLQRRGALIRAHDPAASDEARQVLRDVTLLDNPYQAAQGSHLVLVLTGWDEFKRLDLSQLRAAVATPYLVDGVNVLDPAAARAAGFVYSGIGRR
jgi:UDPglucose 6-dehydrogenase